MNKDIIGKVPWEHVNLKDLEGICWIRKHGIDKYKNPDNWKLVDPKYYLSATLRHITKMQDKGLFSLDDESNLPNIDHVLCDMMFIKYFMRMKEEAEKLDNTNPHSVHFKHKLKRR